MRLVPSLLPILCLFAAACAGNGSRTELAATTDEDALEPPVGRTLAVTGDLRLAPGDYLRPTTAEDPVLLLEGLSGVELDLEDVVLRGAPEGSTPDQASGIGLIVRDCDDLVLRGGVLTGYRVGLLVEGSRGVSVEGLEVTDFHATELFGSPGNPHLADRLDVADPENWLENYGAAIAVVSSSGVTLEETRSRRGQNGVVWINVQGCELTNSDHSYLSGWGVALVESVGCRITNNRFDACTRGVSGDAPPDGMGAAGVLLGADCERNVIAYNVARSCGDGLRVEGNGTGAGNLWFGNDLSGSLASAGAVHGAANERLIGNRLSGGEWRGLHVEDSTGVVIYGNEFQGVHGTGLSLVSSRDCLLVGNQLIDCDLALLVRGRENGGTYDCESHWIVDNEVDGAVQDVVLERARDLVFDGNRFDSPTHRVHLDGLTAAGEEAEESELWTWLRSADSGAPSGRATDVQLS
ncbi:MAG: right-handed parallel beta-helix repeat-containing protein, partial [Planctomycetes bacterium]|nr:right-handed parallel beta-helix repeat-containing protein [Planctomycetota bacterium]